MVDLVYDPKDRSLYFELRQGVVATTVEMVNDRVIFDLDEDGRLLSVEFVLNGLKDPTDEATPLDTMQDPVPL